MKAPIALIEFSERVEFPLALTFAKMPSETAPPGCAKGYLQKQAMLRNEAVNIPAVLHVHPLDHWIPR